MADTKIAYGTPADVAITIVTAGPTGLASDASLLTGRESALVTNTSDLYVDYLITGFFTTGTTPTVAKAMELWCYGQVEDSATPTFPAGLSGADASATLTNDACKGLALRPVATWSPPTTSNIKYHIPTTSVASLFGGRVPRKFGFFFTHSTVAAMNTTSSNHKLTVTPVYYRTT